MESPFLSEEGKYQQEHYRHPLSIERSAGRDNRYERDGRRTQYSSSAAKREEDFASKLASERLHAHIASMEAQIKELTKKCQTLTDDNTFLLSEVNRLEAQVGSAPTSPTQPSHVSSSDNIVASPLASPPTATSSEHVPDTPLDPPPARRRDEVPPLVAQDKWSVSVLRQLCADSIQFSEAVAASGQLYGFDFSDVLLRWKECQFLLDKDSAAITANTVSTFVDAFEKEHSAVAEVVAHMENEKSLFRIQITEMQRTEKVRAQAAAARLSELEENHEAEMETMHATIDNLEHQLSAVITSSNVPWTAGLPDASAYVADAAGKADVNAVSSEVVADAPTERTDCATQTLLSQEFVSLALAADKQESNRVNKRDKDSEIVDLLFREIEVLRGELTRCSANLVLLTEQRHRFLRSVDCHPQQMDYSTPSFSLGESAFSL